MCAFDQSTVLLDGGSCFTGRLLVGDWGLRSCDRFVEFSKIDYPYCYGCAKMFWLTRSREEIYSLQSGR